MWFWILDKMFEMFFVWSHFVLVFGVKMRHFAFGVMCLCDFWSLDEIFWRIFICSHFSIVLFPEGISYTASRVQPLKTGAARVAQEFFQQTGKHVPIVPIGLNYLEKVGCKCFFFFKCPSHLAFESFQDKWRSHVLLNYGPALYLDNSIQDPREQVRELTSRLEGSLLSLTINAVDFETMLDLRLTRKLYTDGAVLTLEQHVELQKKFADFYAEKHAEPEIVALRKGG